MRKESYSRKGLSKLTMTIVLALVLVLSVTAVMVSSIKSQSTVPSLANSSPTNDEKATQGTKIQLQNNFFQLQQIAESQLVDSEISLLDISGFENLYREIEPTINKLIYLFENIYIQNIEDFDLQNSIERGWFDGEIVISNDMCVNIVAIATFGAYCTAATIAVAIAAGWISTSTIAAGIVTVSAALAALAPWMFTVLIYILAKVMVFAINLIEAIIQNKSVVITTFCGVPTGSYVR